MKQIVFVKSTGNFRAFSDNLDLPIDAIDIPDDLFESLNKAWESVMLAEKVITDYLISKGNNPYKQEGVLNNAR